MTDLENKNLSSILVTQQVQPRLQTSLEGPSKKNEARMVGRTPCDKLALFNGSERHRGQLMDVRVTRVSSFTLYGDPAVVGW